MMETDFEEGNLLFTDEYKKALEKASYEIVGNHSAVELSLIHISEPTRPY